MRMSNMGIVSVTAIVFMWLTAFMPVSSAELGDPQRGHDIAQNKCAKCHAINLDGVSPISQAPPFRTFSRKWPIESLEEALAEGIQVGHGPMPEFVFEPGQIADLTAYLRTIQEGAH